MPEKPESVPQPAQVQAALDQVVLPLLRTACKEIKHPLSATVEVVRDGAVVGDFGSVVDDSEQQGPAQAGKIRLRFRDTHSGERVLFFLDAVFDRDERVPGFAGFTASGDIVEKAGGSEAKAASWVMKWWDWNWSKWL